MNIAIFNTSSRVDAKSLSLMVLAVAFQARNHFAKAWGMSRPCVELVDTEADAGPEIPVIGIFDSADTAGALGYHSETPDGREYGRVFVSPILDAAGGLIDGHYSVSQTLSHEVMELMADPFCTRWELGPAIKEGMFYAFEVADPVQDGSYDVHVNGGTAKVSDFVTPAWFDDDPGPQVVSHLNAPIRPFTVDKGGYMIVTDGKRENSVFGKRVFHEVMPPEWRIKSTRHSAARSARRVGGDL